MRRKMIKHASRIMLSAAILAGLAWLAASSAPVTRAKSFAEDKPPAVQVKIDNFSYEPPEITVPAGTTVVWTNADDVPHTVTSNDDKFKSKALDTDDKFAFTFTAPGTYDYYCSVHPKMTAKVVVK
jgi:amicyanin